MPDYKCIPIKAITESASREAMKLGLNFNDIERMLSESYDCLKNKRKEGIEERCVRIDNGILKIVIEFRVSKSGYEYWRVRQIGFVR